MRFALTIAAALLAGLPFAVQAQQQMTWGETEVIGLKRLKREQITSLLPIKVGEVADQKEKEMLKWCEPLRKLPVLAVSCNGAVVGTKLYYVVEILEDTESDAILQASRSPRASGRVSPDARKLLAMREHRVQEVIADGYMPGEQITPSGILVSDDPELRAFDAQLRDFAMGQQDKLIAMVLDANHPERRDAISMLQWAGNPAFSIAAIQGRLLDPDTEVRNFTARFILTFIERLRDSEVAESLALTLTKVLTLPSHADRTKALAILSPLYTLHPEIRPTLRLEASEPLAKIARESVLPGVGGEARGLLAAIGGAE